MEESKSLYQQVIAPHEKKIVWYSFREKLPEVSPLERHGISQPARAEVTMAEQTIISRPPARSPARQMIWLPAPQAEIQLEVRLPNLLAFETPKVPAKPVPPKPFTPPAERRRPTGAPVLPAAPAVQLAMHMDHPLLPVSAPAAPGKPQPKAFIPPPEEVRTAALPPESADAPGLAATGPASNLTAAVVGLKPADQLDIPLPDRSQSAQFSGAPELRSRGGSGEPVESARIFVPDLMIRNGSKDAIRAVLVRRAPTSMENLAASAHGAPVPEPPQRPAAARVSSAPVPLLEGRVVYSMAIQMPNVTSYTGSWIVWFAEREQRTPAPADMRAPVPLRKVDPKYFPAAMDDRVEGKVRLAAVIRNSGRVESVSLLQHLDDRLDLSAEEALSKWEFEPALRNGEPVDVDAVVEIPFRLAPRAGR